VYVIDNGEMTTERSNRQSHRLRGYDYTATGSYFMTICTHDRRYLFGNVINGEMVCSPCGEIASREWQVSVGMRREIITHAFVVMPNHVHGLITLAPDSAPTAFESDLSSPRLRPPSLGAFVNAYTGAVTRAIKTLLNDPSRVIWQRNYYDHIVRDERDFESILAYIENNPGRWHEDRFNDTNL
jgi:REP element-mobilizing transposase RayT